MKKLFFMVGIFLLWHISLAEIIYIPGINESLDLDETEVLTQYSFLELMSQGGGKVSLAFVPTKFDDKIFYHVFDARFLNAWIQEHSTNPLTREQIDPNSIIYFRLSHNNIEALDTLALGQYFYDYYKDDSEMNDYVWLFFQNVVKEADSSMIRAEAELMQAKMCLTGRHAGCDVLEASELLNKSLQNLVGQARGPAGELSDALNFMVLNNQSLFLFALKNTPLQLYSKNFSLFDYDTFMNDCLPLILKFLIQSENENISSDAALQLARITANRETRLKLLNQAIEKGEGSVKAIAQYLLAQLYADMERYDEALPLVQAALSGNLKESEDMDLTNRAYELLHIVESKRHKTPEELREKLVYAQRMHESSMKPHSGPYTPEYVYVNIELLFYDLINQTDDPIISAEARYGLAKRLFDLEKYRYAETELKLLLEQNVIGDELRKNAVDLLRQVIKILEEQKRKIEEAELQKKIALDQGIALYEARKYKGAIPLLERAYESMDFNVKTEAAVKLARIYLGYGESYKEVKLNFEKASLYIQFLQNLNSPYYQGLAQEFIVTMQFIKKAK